MLGGHAVKLIGWGTTDDGEDYWVYNPASSFFITVTKSVLMADLHSLFLVAAYGESVEPKLGRCISLLKLLTLR